MVRLGDVYGYYPVGQCTACTISSTTLTLGGTITGQFRVGDTLVGGGGITGVAICRFNGNGNQCNGWLLKRDVDPASNDNAPMWTEKAA